MSGRAYRHAPTMRPVRQERRATPIGRGTVECSIWLDPHGHRFQFGAKGSTLELSTNYAQAHELRAALDAFVERCRQMEDAPDLLHARREGLAP